MGSRLQAILNKNRTSQTQGQDIDLDPYIQMLSKPTFIEQAEEAKPKVSWWKKLISVVTSGETGQAAFDFLDGKNPIEAYGKSVVKSIQGQGFDKKTYADVLEKIGFSTKKLSDLFPDLYSDTGEGIFKFKKNGFLDWSANGTTGLALDILLDPTTYMGGAGLFARMGIKGKNLTKEGMKIYERGAKMAQKVADDAGGYTDDVIKTIEKITLNTKNLLEKNADKNFKGITWFGANVLPRKIALAPGRLLDGTMQHIPILGDVYTGAKAGVQDIFKYGADVIRKGAKISNAGKETAEGFVNAEKRLYQRVEEIKTGLTDDLTDIIKKFKSADIPKADRDATWTALRDKIELQGEVFGIKGFDDKAAKEMAGYFENITTKFYRTEKEAAEAIDKGMYDFLAGYVRHNMTEEGRKMMTLKNANKYLPAGAMQFSASGNKSRVFLRFVDETGEAKLGTKEHFGLQEYAKKTEEALLTKRADRLVKTKEYHLIQINREVKKLEKEGLHTALKPVKETPIEGKVATLEVKPSGKFKLNPIRVKNSENMKFIEKWINLPKSEMIKIAKKIGTRNKNLEKTLNEIYDITNRLDDDIADLPDVQKWFKDKEGKVWRIDRSATISEINATMQASMDAMAKEGNWKKGTKFMDEDLLKITYDSGVKSAKRIATYEFYKDITEKFAIKGEVKRVFERKPQTGKNIGSNLIGKTDEATGEFKEIWRDPNTGIDYIDPKMPDYFPEGTMMPTFLVSELKKFKEFVDNEEIQNQLLKGYDKILNFWKGSVYGWYPASHGRNLIGGIFNNWLAGLKPLDSLYFKAKAIASGKNGTILLDNGVKVTYEQIRKGMLKTGVLGQTGYLDANQLNRALNPGWLKKAENLPVTAMTMVENQLRIPLYVKKLQQTGSFEEAAKSVFKYHFDYSPQGLTKFERNVFRRLIPFYTWTRNNIPLMLEEFIAQPGKLTGMFKSLRDMQDEDGNIMQDLLPSYIEKEFAISRGGQTITGTGIPVLEMLKMMREPVRTLESGLTPFLKIPLELRTKFSLFRDQSVMEDTSGTFAEKYPQVVKDWLNYEEQTITKKDGTSYVKKTVDPMRKYWLYALPTARLASVLTMVGGEKEKNKILNAISGIRTMEYDKQQLAEQQNKIYEEKIIEILTNAGIFGQIQYPYSDYKDIVEQEELIR